MVASPQSFRGWICHIEARPVGYGMIDWRAGAIVSDDEKNVAPQITPFPTGRTMADPLPGISCLATFVSSPPGQRLVSLRDADGQASCLFNSPIS
jgi:hypothetical protein